MNNLNVSKQNPKLQFKKSTISKLNDQLLSNKAKFISRGIDTVIETIGCEF